MFNAGLEPAWRPEDAHHVAAEIKARKAEGGEGRGTYLQLDPPRLDRGVQRRLQPGTETLELN